ncbi:hypothetical protein CFP56_016820 [Quercus suber]|uniref:Uncharacterized protein n=1 Tax=Quercus suber TaxID=58331 RepID=A0AAW0KME3_QUESU
MRSANRISQSHRFTQTSEVLLGNLQNLKLHESFEEHASASLKRNASCDEIQAVNEASERLLESLYGSFNLSLGSYHYGRPLRFTQTGEDLGGNLQNLKLHESLEEHAFASFKRNFFNDESQEVKEASDRPLEA